MRMRGVRYWWAGLGLLVLSLLYIGPVAASFRMPALPARTSPLPALSVPRVAFPQLQIPKLRMQAPLPALPRATKTKAGSPAQAATTGVRHRVPVVSDTHSQRATAPTTEAEKPIDPFANVPVVNDSVGSPLNLPTPTPAAAPAVPPTSAAAPTTGGAATTAPATDPAPTTDPPTTVPAAGSSLGWFSVADVAVACRRSSAASSARCSRRRRHS
jgi:hypothetical protein